jgi:glycosyltransferase involved in cell wall biosynthesis
VIKLLYVVPTLEYSGAARKVMTLAGQLPRDRFTIRVAVLGSGTAWVQTLRSVGIAVDVLGWTRTIDLRPLLTLMSVFRSFQPEVVHAWSALALRGLAVIGTGRSPRLFVSDLLLPGQPLAFWDELLVRKADAVLAFSEAEAERYRRSGVARNRVTTIPPAIDALPDACVELALPPALPPGRVLLGIGPLEMHKGFRDAVWALDILHYLYSDLHLVLAGNGKDRARVAHFAQSVGADERVHFVGPVPTLAPLLYRAAVVWVPSRNQGGVCAALEAMAAGRPVVATRTGGLDEIIVDGVTGFLVWPGDKAGLARQTRLLLDDAELAARLGEAGRQRVLENFTAARMAEQCERVYAGKVDPGLQNPHVPP